MKKLINETLQSRVITIAGSYAELSSYITFINKQYKNNLVVIDTINHFSNKYYTTIVIHNDMI